MKTAKMTACACGVIAALIMGFCYAQNGKIYPAIAFALLGAVWCEGILRPWNWLASLMLIIFAGGAVYGAWQGFTPVLMLVGICAALSAWDLDHMLQRFAKVKPAGVMNGLERHHMIRLAEVNGIGLILGGSVFLFKIHISFALALVLGLAAVIALSQIVLFLRRTNG